MAGERLTEGLRSALTILERGTLPAEKLEGIFREWILGTSPSFEEFLNSKALAPLSTVTLRPVQTDGSDQDPYSTQPVVPESLYSTIDASTASSSLQTALNSSNVGQSRFQRIKQHAQGGLGVVFLAKDGQIDREVALKQIRKDRTEDADLQRKFVVEAEITGQLEHPGIVPVYALGLDAEGAPYYAMKFIRGEELKRYVDRMHSTSQGQKLDYGSVSFRKLLGRFLDVCNTIDYAHSRGILHRDLKPANIMLGSHGETLVVDWGLAKLLTKVGDEHRETVSTIDTPPPVRLRDCDKSSETHYGTFSGSIPYAPPEQLLGQVDRMGPGTDVYSLGAILFQVLTNRPPIQVHSRVSTLDELAKALAEAVELIRNGDSLNPRVLVPAIPRAHAMICLRALAFQLENRYSSAKELAADVERWLADERVLALGNKEPLLEKAGRWLRRYRTWTIPIVSAVGFSAAIAILGAVLINRARVNEKTAKLSAIEYKNEAVDRIGVARNAIDTLLVGTSESLSYLPATRDLQRRLLEVAAGDYQKLSKSSSTDPELELERIRAMVRVADIQHMQMDYLAAEETYNAALELIEGKQPQFRAARSDIAVRWLVELGKTLGRRGLALDIEGRKNESRGYFDRSISTLQILERDYPDSSAVHLGLARVLVYYANFLSENAESSHAIPLLEKSIFLFSQDDLNREWQNQLARYRAVESLGRVLSKVGRNQEAIALLRDVERELQGLLAERKKDREVLTALASNQFSMATIHRRVGKWKEAQSSLDSALSIFTQLRTAWPDNIAFSESLALAAMDIGLVSLDQKRFADAGKSLEEARVQFSNLANDYPQVNSFRLGLATALSGLGQSALVLDPDPKLSINHFEQSIRLLVPMAQQSQDPKGETTLIAAVWGYLAQALVRDDRLDDAAKQFSESISAYSSLEEAYTTDTDITYAKADVKWKLGIFEHQQGHAEQASKHWSESIASMRMLIQKNMDNEFYKVWLAKKLMRCSDTSLISLNESLSLIDSIRKSDTANSRYVVLAAECYARSGQAEKAKEMLIPILGDRDSHIPEVYAVLALAEQSLRNSSVASDYIAKCRMEIETIAPYDNELLQLLSISIQFVE